jgi:hypothetical protein
MTDPESGIEYEVEFSVASHVDSYGRLIPVVDNVDTMMAEDGYFVNFAYPPNLQWFEMHKESIFEACYESIKN